jgi:hypothetical protein
LVDALKADILKHSVVHADETPVQMLKPGSGKTHRSYLRQYPSTFGLSKGDGSSFRVAESVDSMFHPAF